jgi:tetratricopeptide (TPR) repeat protein
MVARDPSVAEWRTAMRGRCLTLRARLALAAGAPAEALAIARQAVALARMETRPVDRAFAVASAMSLSGDAHRAMNQPEEAALAWQAARAAWPPNTELTPQQQAELALLELRLGRRDQAKRVADRLQAMGYRQTAYLQSLKNGGRTS